MYVAMPHEPITSNERNDNQSSIQTHTKKEKFKLGWKKKTNRLNNAVLKHCDEEKKKCHHLYRVKIHYLCFSLLFVFSIHITFWYQIKTSSSLSFASLFFCSCHRLENW